MLELTSIVAPNGYVDMSDWTMWVMQACRLMLVSVLFFVTAGEQEERKEATVRVNGGDAQRRTSPACSGASTEAATNGELHDLRGG